MRKKITILIILAIIIIFAYVCFKIYSDWRYNFAGKRGIGEGRTTIYTEIRNLIPQELKQFIKQTVLFVPLVNQKLDNLEKTVDFLTKENQVLWLSANNIQSNYFPLKLTRKTIPIVSRNQHGKSTAYIDLHENNMLIITGYGSTYSVSINDLIEKSVPDFLPIENNLYDLVKSKYFWDLEKKTKFPYPEEMSVKDILVHNDNLFISYNREVSDECFNTSILRADLNYNYLNFENFFDYDDCISGLMPSSSMKGGGGRMFPYKNKLLFTIGDSGSLRSQEDNFLLGKIIEIDLETKNFEIISKGHRNPQGLVYLKDREKIFSSEHGSNGGDEFNQIFKNKNYGWPISSYGTGPQLYQNHKDHGFEEPLLHFTPSIGPSEIIQVPKEFSEKWSENILLTSLSGRNGYGKSIYRLEMSDDYNSVLEVEQIKIGDRIRDIKYTSDYNLFILVLEYSNSIGLLYR